MREDGVNTLSLHVLDTARGGPGTGLAFTLDRIDQGEVRVRLVEGETDAAGRWAAAASLSLAAGSYEIVFGAGVYQARVGAGASGFYDLIAIRFRTQEDGVHYHIPLILAPFGYSTYRGG